MPKILIVDDDPDISLALVDYLHQEQFDVEMAYTGKTALEKGLAHHYDAVLLDVGLPDLDGIEVLEKLSREKPELPVILLTAFTSLSQTSPSDILEKSFAYLIKPYSREEIRHALRQAVNSKGSQYHRDTSSEDSANLQPFPSPNVQPSPNSMPKTTGPYNQLLLYEYQRLVESVQLMQFAFDHVPEAILVADADKRFRFANQAAHQILGYNKEELEALRIPDIAPNYDSERYHDHLNELRQGKPLSYYTTHRTKHGQNIPVEISVYLLNFHGQEFTCAISKQITEQPTAAEKDHSHTGLSG